MGKWSSLKGQYPELPWEEKVRAAAAVIADEPVHEIVAMLNIHEQRKAEAERDLAAIKLDVETYERALIAAMERDGLESIKAHGHHWTPSIEPYPQQEDKLALREFFDQHMPEALQIPWQTLKSLTKDALENGKALPPGVKVFLKPSISRRKAKE